MKPDRQKTSTIAIVFFALLLAAIFSPLDLLGPHPPKSLPTVATTDADQEIFLRQLQLGWRQETQHNWEEAQKAYAEAALANQDEIARQARNGLFRVMRHQQGFWPQFQQGARALTPLWVLLLIAFVLWLIFTRPVNKPGYSLLTFDDYTQKSIGTGLQSLLYFRIQEAHHIHDLGQTQLLGFATAEFPLFASLSGTNDELADILSSLEALSIGGVEVPFGKLIITIRGWLNRRKYTIAGNLGQLGDEIYLYCEIRNTNSGKITASWELAGQNPTKLSLLIEELAYRLLFHIAKTSQNAFEASSWRSLMLFTQGLCLIQADSRLDIRRHLMQAQTLFQEVVTIDPGFLMAQYILGITQTRLGAYQEARRQFDDIIEADRNLVVEATYNLGLTFYHEFRPWAYEMASTCYQGVIEATENKATTDPNQQLLRALAFAGLANTAAQMIGEESVLEQHSKETLMTEVEKNCQSAEQLIVDRELDYQTRFVHALIYNARGIASYYAHHLRAAKSKLKTALRYQPENLVAYGYLALASLKENNEPQALNWFDRTLEWNPAPRYIEYFFYKFGRYFHTNEDWNRAIDYYSQAPNHPFALNYLGEVYTKTDDFKRAIATFRQATKLNGKIPLFWQNIANTIPKMDKADLLPEALEAAHRAVSLQDDWLSRDILGWVYYHMENFPEAERQLYTSIKLNEHKVRNHYHLARVFWEQENHNKALEMIEKAFATPDKSPQWRKRTAELRAEITGTIPPQA